jgi:hypothetical protein
MVGCLHRSKLQDAVLPIAYALGIGLNVPGQPEGLY